MANDPYRKLGSLFVPQTVTETQPIVLWFGQEMEKLLAMDKHKNSPAVWRSTDVYTLRQRLNDQVRNLRLACESNPLEVEREAAGVANIAMMIADWYESRLAIADIDGTE